MKATPGPWRVGEHFAGPDERVILSDGTNPNGTDQIIGEVWAPTAEANARLIASAPDLYEALRDLALHVEDDHRTMNAAPGRTDRARAALAKADGR